MAKFSKLSQERLSQCHPDLQKLFNEVVKHYDCIILCGHRGEKEQNDAFSKGFSKLKFPKSKHNKLPSMAVDVARVPLNWNDREGFIHFAGYVTAVADQLGIKIRCGIDFDQDANYKNGFFDGPHFEII
jgi:hypothetical protein